MLSIVQSGLWVPTKAHITDALLQLRSVVRIPKLFDVFCNLNVNHLQC